MKKIIFSLIVSAMIITMTGCGSSKGFTYLENVDSISLAGSRGLYDARIMPKDELTITVNTIDPDAAAPFNLQGRSSSGGRKDVGSSGGASQGYLVDNSGFINFPIIGKIQVSGLTKPECETLIKSKIQPYLSRTENPIVTVRMSSYHVTVLGEVGQPGVIPVNTEKMSVLEALAQAGDLGVYGKRDNIMLIREDMTGQKHVVRLNLNDANILNSPYYYLQQNDVLYVEPNHVKAKNSSVGPSTTLWFSFVGIITSVASLVVSVLR